MRPAMQLEDDTSDRTIEVWGLAAGRRSTADAAHGALCVRDYDTEEEARAAATDFVVVLAVRGVERRP